MEQSTLALIIIAVIIVMYITEVFSVAVTSLIGMFALIYTNVLSFNDAFACMVSTPALLTIGMIIVADAILESGVGNEIGVLLTKVVGHREKLFVIVANPVALVTIFMLTGFILSQFMSNGSLVSMLAAIGVPLAIQIGRNPMPVALACVYGCSLAMATPVATTSITIVQVAGYRFKDYLRIGGLVGLIGAISAWLSIVIIYGLI
ncbi:MAG: hypothetical protein IJO54_03295 [Oscillospiraceae bacterium]|nr:hypothetical protein [Oscillospiraceae bacterium]